MSFKVGDKVKFLHEKGEGMVTALISPHKVLVELTEGLEIEVYTAELLHTKGMPIDEMPITPKEGVKKKAKAPVSKPHASHEMEVDLHIEELTENSYSMNNAQKLNMQLDYFQDSLDRAMQSHIRKIIFIHGVGNGVLRQSIRDILKRYDGVEYSDGSYSKYGAGATEVRIVSKAKAKLGR
jgi:dsDNA-specific endonuclease/ATPase MutS2